jgi:NDP-sugar pyrophosphorylase family protein
VIDAGIRSAVLLVGGLGTRLRPLTYARPKPILPVVNIPLVGHQLLWFAAQGVRRVRLAAGYGAEQVREELSRRDWGLTVEVIVEEQPLDTAGALKLAGGDLHEPFFATNGDILLNAPLAPMAAAQAAAGATASILLRRVDDVSHYGLVVRDDVGHVAAFLEKQPTDPSGQNTVNAGVYLLQPDALDFVPEGTSWSVERQLYPDLLAAGRTVLGHVPEAPYYWLDVGRMETYLQAHLDLLDGAVEWFEPDVAPGDEVTGAWRGLGPLAMGEGCSIGDGAILGPNVCLGRNVKIGAGAQVASSVLWDGAEVGEGARLEKVIVAGDARVGAGQTLFDRIVMGP